MGDRLVQAIVLVPDLASARRQMETLGLTVLDGGRHPGRGTANLIVAFGQQYLELLAIVDEAEALSSPQGRPVAAALKRRGPGLARWSVETDDIDAAARRVGYPVEERHRILGSGHAIRWRSVAVDATWEQPWRCAFMAWDDPEMHPARSGGGEAHPNGATGFARLDVAVPDCDALLGWIGAEVPDGVVASSISPVSPTLPVGEAGPTRLVLASPGGPIAVA